MDIFGHTTEYEYTALMEAPVINFARLYLNIFEQLGEMSYPVNWTAGYLSRIGRVANNRGKS